MATSGDTSVLQELETMRSIDKVPAEVINQGFIVDHNGNGNEWFNGLQDVTALLISAAKGYIEMVRLVLLHPQIAVNAAESM
eukprot:scaffold4218_cov166-Ochromonas_danica.AAC.1